MKAYQQIAVIFSIFAVTGCSEESVSEPSSPLVFSATNVPVAFPSFTLAIDTPNAEVIYTGDEAKRLARAVIPAAAERIVRARVRPNFSIPSGGYHSTNLEFAFEREPVDGTCFQGFITISMSYDISGTRPKQLAFVFENGLLRGHRFQSISTDGRFQLLRNPPRSPKAMKRACDAVEYSSTEWIVGKDPHDFLANRERVKHLFSAVRAGNAKVTCFEHGDKPCSSGSAALYAALRKHSPQTSNAIEIPGTGRWWVYNYWPTDGSREIYTVTAKLREHEEIAEIRIDFDEYLPPPI